MILIIRLALDNSRIYPDLGPDEEITDEALAVHGVAFRDAGGWIFLTNQHVRFKSHRFSTRKRKLAFPLSDIAQVSRPASRRGRKQLFVHLKTGEVEQFTVEDAEDWESSIQESLP